MALKTWKGWTEAQREASYRKTKEAMRRGEIPYRPKACQHCGQTKGRVMWHNDNYDHPTKYLVAVCFRCHIMFYHGDETNAEACEHYRQQVKNGAQFPPATTFADLARDNGLTKYRKFDPARYPMPKTLRDKEENNAGQGIHGPSQQSFDLGSD